MSETLRQEPDPYWTDDRALTTVQLRHAAYAVHIRSYTAQERSTGTAGDRLFALRELRGPRTYLQSRLYLPSASRYPEQRLADGQAWHYPAETAVVLWELVPASSLWQPDPAPPRGLSAAHALARLRALPL